MKKRILSLLLVLLMVVSLMPTAALAYTSTDIKYKVEGGYIYFDQTTGTITDCYTSVTEADIPETIEGVKVTNIGNYAFSLCRSLTSVKIPNSVTNIGGSAFKDCTSLTNITIPDSVTSIGDSAFSGCISLTSINVEAANTAYISADDVLFNKDKTELIRYPAKKADDFYTIFDSVTSIAGGAFSDCTSLTSIEIPNSVTSIAGGAFSDCTSLTSIEIPNSVTSIAGGAFSDCTSLTSIEIPNSVTSIASYAFSGCTGLTSVEIPNSVVSIDWGAFRGCTSLTSIEIPNSVIRIADNAFSSCTGLTSLTIPENVVDIYDNAFKGCTGLVSVTILCTMQTSIGRWAFEGCASLKTLDIDGCFSIQKSAFQDCTSLETVNIGSCRYIGEYAFKDCTAFKNLTLPLSGLFTIGQSAFQGCTSLETLNIPSAETIDVSAFSGCKALTSVSLPKNIKTIGNAAFRYCDNIKDVYYAGSETEWNAIDFTYFNEALTGATIHYAGETHTHNYVDGVCTICGAKDPNYVPPHTHDYKAVVTAPTCTEKGYTTHTCSCGGSYVDSYTNALGHDYKDGKCTRCGAKDPGQTHEHDYKSTVTKPTCTERGYTTHTCSCGDSYVDNYKDALGHLYIFGKCIRCGEKEDSSETHTHDYKSRVVEPTCTEGGYTLWECECGKSYETLHTDALGHDYKDGLCTRCGAKDPNAHTHKYVETVVKPTCTEKGYTTYTCSVCGDIYKGSYTNALGHSYSNGVCTRCGVKDPGAAAPSFVDVPSTSYCYDAVQWAVANGVTAGTDSTHFSPNAGCTRAQVVTFLWRAAGKPIVNTYVNFVDVKSGAYYYEAVKWAVANGITAGTDAAHFSPNATCTRGQVVTFLYRAAKSPSVSTVSSFSDVAAGSYCYNAVSWAVANGITAGTGGNRFSPNATCTRGQVVTFLYRAQ